MLGIETIFHNVLCLSKAKGTDINMETKFYNSKNAPKPNKPIHLGAVGLIINHNKILLEKRKDSERWAFIGGGMKMEESLEDCVKREVFEETGLKAQNIKLLNVFSSPYRIAAYPDGNIVRIVTALFYVEVSEFQTMACSEESKEIKFFNKDEIEKLDLAETHLDIWEYMKSHIF
jgi:ADP-ribose pyrophosphatase YjhB (NUDIX family)